MQSTQNPTTQKQAGKTAKFKSAADTDASGVNQANQWKQPLRRHINPDTQKVEFVTILVRVLNGEAEHDFHARFSDPVLRAGVVCSAIAEKEQLTPQESKLFSLWVVSKDLEIQIRPEQDIFALMVFWNKWMMKYTHFPEAENPHHHLNRHWFVYRREALVTLQEERNLAGNVGMSLLFGEAKRNLLTKRYVCTHMEAATIAGLQLQIAYGDYDPGRCTPGYLVEENRLEQLLPIGMTEKMRPNQWEDFITIQYKSFFGLGVAEARLQFLDFVRNMPCYGCSIFPVCAELPPSGFFEYRTQNWFLGAGPNGLVIMDFETQKYVAVCPWSEVNWYTGPDQLFLNIKKNDKQKELWLITPQFKLIENLCMNIKYKWAKETGVLKPKASDLKEVVVDRSVHVNKSRSADNLRRAGQGSFDNLKSITTGLKSLIDKLSKKVLGDSSDRVRTEESYKKSQNSLITEEKFRELFPETILPKNYAPTTPQTPRQSPRKSMAPQKDNRKSMAPSKADQSAQLASEKDLHTSMAPQNDVDQSARSLSERDNRKSMAPQKNNRKSMAPSKGDHITVSVSEEDTRMSMAPQKVVEQSNRSLSVKVEHPNSEHSASEEIVPVQPSTPTRGRSANRDPRITPTAAFQSSPRITKKRSPVYGNRRRQTDNEKLLLEQLESVNPLPSSPFSQPQSAPKSTVQNPTTEDEGQQPPSTGKRTQQRVSMKPTAQAPMSEDEDQPSASSGKRTSSGANSNASEPAKLIHSQLLLEKTRQSHLRSASESKPQERTGGGLGTYVKTSRQTMQVKQSGIQVNKRSSTMFGFDDHLGGIGPTKLIDKRQTKLAE